MLNPPLEINGGLFEGLLSLRLFENEYFKSFEKGETFLWGYLFFLYYSSVFYYVFRYNWGVGEIEVEFYLYECD